MGRGRVEIRRIANDVSRRATFGKRSAGLLKKARELAVLCDAHLGVLVFDGAGDGTGTARQLDYCSPHTRLGFIISFRPLQKHRLLKSNTRWTELIQRYDSITNDQLQGNQGINHHEHQQLLADIARLRRERDHLEAIVQRQTGEDLPSGATAAELRDLEQRLESALDKVREMKDKLMEEQLEESHHRVHILEDQSSFLGHMMSEEGQQRAAVEASAVVAELMAPVQPATLFGGFFPEVEEEEAATSLRLWP